LCGIKAKADVSAVFFRMITQYSGVKLLADTRLLTSVPILSVLLLAGCNLQDDYVRHQVLRQLCTTEPCSLSIWEETIKRWGDYHFYIYGKGGDGSYGTAGALVRGSGVNSTVLKVVPGLVNGDVREAKFHNLDRHDYLEIYESTSKGNGSIELYRIDPSQATLVFEARGFDEHEDGATFDGGLLRASYPDVNKDLHFDIVLEGTVVFSYDSLIAQHGGARKYCKRIFLWNEDSKMFAEIYDGAINLKLCK
jgi:hypothetical protein